MIDKLNPRGCAPNRRKQKDNSQYRIFDPDHVNTDLFQSRLEMVSCITKFETASQTKILLHFLQL
jgi:hypothetical protein